MNLVPGGIIGEVIPPGEGGVTVFCRPHPLRSARTVTTLPAGLTLAEITALSFLERRARPATAYLGEEVIPEANWSKVRPKPGTTVSIVARLEGNALKSIAMIAVAAVALFASGGFAAPFLGAAFAAGTWGAAALGLGLTIAGSLLINQLFPVAKPKQNQSLADKTEAAETRATSYSISGAQNQTKAFGAIPDVLGRNRTSPPYAAKPYTEIIGDDQYLRLLFCWGYGPLAIEDLKIGETPLSSFGDYEIETREGYPGDAPITLYPAQVDQDDLSIELKHSGGFYKRTTQTDIDEVSVDITAPAGVYRFDKSTGAYNGNTVTARVFYRLLPSGSETYADAVSFTKETGQARRALRIVLPARGQYEIWIDKPSADEDTETVKGTLVWTALRSIRNEHPVKFDKPLALTALRIKATSQLSGVIDTFNGIVSARVMQADGEGGWTPDTVSSNPADLFRRVLQGPANARPAGDDAIALDNLSEWAAVNKASGFRFNMVRESATSVYGTLTEIAAAGRAVPVFLDGKWGVIWERFDAPVVQHFTPRNSWGFNGERAYRRFPHGLRIRFINEEKEFQQDERIVYDDGYDETNATLFEAIELPGITDPDLIWKFGRYHIAQARLRPERYSFFADFEHLRCTRGDRVRVAHDIPLWGQISGRVKALDGPKVTLDETVTIEAGKLYAARFRLADGTSLVRSVVVEPGETDTITLEGSGSLPAKGDLAMFGEAERETVVLRVLSIEHQADLVAKITCVDDAPEIANADTGPIPAFDSRISAAVDSYEAPPKNLSAREIVEGSGGAKTATIRLSWQPTRLARVKAFEVQIKDELAGSGWSSSDVVAAPQTYYDLRGLLIGTYSFRVRSIFLDDSPSTWATLPASQITGIHLTSPLPNVTELRSTFVDQVMNLQWQEVTDFREVFYEVRKGDQWESGIKLGTVAHPPFATQGNDTYWVSAAAAPIAGLTVFSEAPASIVISGAVLTQNVIAVWDEKATSWSGIFTGTAGPAGTLIRIGGIGNVLGVSDVLATPDITSLGGIGPGAYEVPLAHNVDVGRIAPCRVYVEWKAAGVRSDQNILSVADLLNDPDVLDSASSHFVDVYPEITTADAVVSGSPNWQPWRRFSPGSYLGRFFKARLVLETNNPEVVAYGLEFTFSVDVPDRLDHYTFDTAAGGTGVVYWPDGDVAAAIFNGGPNGSPTPFVTASILSPLAGDRVVISSQTNAGCTVQVLDASGTGVSRRVSVYAQGF